MKKDNPISYSAVVLDEVSRAKLLSNPQISSLITKNHTIIAHHMTIKLGSLRGTRHESRVGKEEHMVAVKVGTYMDGAVIAVALWGGKSDNKIPHITIAIDESKPVKAKDSNNITNWKDLESPVVLQGTVMELP